MAFCSQSRVRLDPPGACSCLLARSKINTMTTCQSHIGLSYDCSPTKKTVDNLDVRQSNRSIICIHRNHGKIVLSCIPGLVDYNSTYQGELEDGKKHGFGIMIYSNGSSYNGEWCEGKRNGRGLYQYADGASYDGEWCENKKHGRGVLKFADGGSYYDGEWCKDKRHGRGIHKYADGSSYDGEWCEGKQHGRGLHKYADGGSYDGEWCDHKMHGRGVFKFADGGLYDGEWCEDKMHGRGVFKYVDGSSYDGEWCNDKRHGTGRHKYADGSSYNGDWIEDLYHGRGVFKYAEGSLYDGEWCKGKEHGRGNFKYADDGSSYDGEWCEGKKHGRGIFKYADDGSSYDGILIDGRLDDLQIFIQDNSGMQRCLILPADSKTSAIFSAYEEMTGKSPCRLKHKGRYIFYSQSKKKSLKHFGICNDDVVAVEVPVPTNMSDKFMTNHTATSSTEKPKVAKTKRQPSQQRRPWVGSVMDNDSDRMKHSSQMNLVLKEIQPRLEKIRQHLHGLSLKRTQPKDKAKTSKKARANHKQIECLPSSVGIGSKAGRGSFVVNVGEANNLYKTSKQSKLIRSNPSASLDLHKLTKEQALAALNDSLPTWIETANSGMYPFVIQIRIICGKGSQALSEVVMQWIDSQQQVAHAPKQKQ
eukprot:scaffold6369_cov73-Cyclotella_meneghiniana.AAC.3